MFKEHITMLRNNGLDLQIEEGYYWYENSIIKAFDSDGVIHKICRVNISNDLSISFKKYKFKRFEVESWNDTIIRLNDSISKKERETIRIFKTLKNTDRTIACLSSTGKDSIVNEYLAKKSGLDFKSYFNVSTCDVADSNIMAKHQGYNFILPQFKYKGVYDWMEHENIIPSRLQRGCCTYFKEEPTMKYFNDKDKLILLMGMRNDESQNRSGYKSKWINEKWGKNRDWIGVLGIRKWSDLDIWLLILREELPINEKYKKGYSRVGCGIICPNYSKSTWVLDKYWYPYLYQRWQNKLKADFLKNYKWISVHCTLEEYLQGAWAGGLVRPTPNEEVVKEFAEYKGIDIETAAKYFEKFCMNGCKNIRAKPMKIKDQSTIAMNLKFNGRNIERFMCKKCLMKQLGIDKEQWDKYIEDFKRQGCKLF